MTHPSRRPTPLRRRTLPRVPQVGAHLNVPPGAPPPWAADRQALRLLPRLRRSSASWAYPGTAAPPCPALARFCLQAQLAHVPSVQLLPAPTAMPFSLASPMLSVATSGITLTARMAIIHTRCPFVNTGACGGRGRHPTKRAGIGSPCRSLGSELHEQLVLIPGVPYPCQVTCFPSQTGKGFSAYAPVCVCSKGCPHHYVRAT
jgi:hypothetical protein